MKKRPILNIINFIRGFEPRPTETQDLITPVKEEIALSQKYGFKTTFLLQYDALLNPVFVQLMKELDPNQFEIGIWHEIVQPLTEACGIKWTGRWAWDWHCHCDFPVGYPKEQREQLVDESFRLFKEIFGHYPRVFGSWFYDSHTIRYLCDHYEIDAICNCKEQYGTDGYTLWGSYYGQGYYPSRTNVFMPAQTKEQQINTPLFRMLGSDPVYQYDFGLSIEEGADPIQKVITLEPAYNAYGGGGIKKWVDWYMAENFNGDCLSFGYTQAGQENSFGWERFGAGLTMQYPIFERLVKEGRLEIETLGETGRWYKSQYAMTPPSAITAHSAFDDPEKKSVWYATKDYRINLYFDNGAFRIRDLHLFDENHADPYENTVAEGNEAVYETLPVVDGNRFSGNGVLSGVYPLDSAGEPMRFSDMTFTETGEGEADVTFRGETALTFSLAESSMRVSAKSGFTLKNRIGKCDGTPKVISCSEKELVLSYNNTEYRITLKAGLFQDACTIVSENGVIEAAFA